MAEICCGVVTGATAADAAVSEITPRSARRRRMQIRRFSPVSDETEISEKRKKPRLETSFSPPSTPPGAAGDGKERSTVSNPSITAGVSSSSSVTAPAPSDSGLSRYGITSVCGRRRDMEDAVAVHRSFAGGFDYYGVFDGHGCSHVAVTCKDRMHHIVAEELRSGSLSTAADWTLVMERSFNRMDTEAIVSGDAAPRSGNCRCELQMPKCDHVGSTAVVAVVDADRVVVANCGDSRAILCRDGIAVALSVDHKPDRPDELQRIEDAGGRVIFWDGARVLGVLAMSRAIGDGYLKPFVIADPEVTVTERSGGDECLIVASDGLWDVVSPEMACDVVRTCLRSSSVEAACTDATVLLTKLALARQSSDNVTVVVVDLRRDRTDGGDRHVEDELPLLSAKVGFSRQINILSGYNFSLNFKFKYSLISYLI